MPLPPSNPPTREIRCASIRVHCTCQATCREIRCASIRVHCTCQATCREICVCRRVGGFLVRIDFADTYTARLLCWRGTVLYLCKLTASTVRMPHSINDVCRSDLQQLTKEWNKCILRQKRSASEIFRAHNIRILTIRGNFLS